MCPSQTPETPRDLVDQSGLGRWRIEQADHRRGGEGGRHQHGDGLTRSRVGDVGATDWLDKSAADQPAFDAADDPVPTSQAGDTHGDPRADRQGAWRIVQADGSD